LSNIVSTQTQSMSDSQMYQCVYDSCRYHCTNEQINGNNKWCFCPCSLKYYYNPLKDMLMSDLKVNFMKLL